ncbi:CMP-2-keto-3-deoxyoctulosonic acid synthetase [Eggerthella sp. NSJ-70]|uniref:CMP-2-keto-3-deoxyoctulosonic acid synthetase n=1 Tax=Eggerthella hominis TaxID=2763043 RepID=A0ABR7BQN2_9ACTN|nr:CMP-2-keto-3-deoxyoctulosonic acid synthetase [Eggerthella hominis]MBC5583923.1 CMP-2-keto-3-deoxyoctulosonic acid synthetase [Eggerthella hominis]
MAKKRFIQKKSNLAAKILAVGCASCVLTGCIGFGFASAGSGAAHDIDSFGIDASSTSAAATATQSADFSAATSDAAASPRETTVLTSTASRDISQGIEAIEAEEEAARIAAEEAARAEEEARIAAAEQAKAEQEARAAQESAANAAAMLSEVDFTVGKEAFITQWTSRIDNYLAGSPLAGQGATFAEAAWNNGVDPRWSPAISNTESSKGAVCFKPYNAWGWGSSSWSSWEEAINAHVAGLASGYGYSITVANAQKYCPPTYMDWYTKTISQMQMI